MAMRSQFRLLQSILIFHESGPAGLAVVARRHQARSVFSYAKPSNPPTSPNRHRPSIPGPLLTPPFRRSFQTSSALSKKGKAPRDTPVPDNAAEHNRRSEVDPFDYSELESGISKAVSRLKEALTKTRSAGRISPEMVENLPVQLNVRQRDSSGGGASAGGKEHHHKESGRLGDYATVVPKGGRTMQVFVAEESHLKPISASILASPYSLVPSPDAHNALLLNIPVPPPTAESRAHAAAEAKKSMERAALEVRTARGDAQKRYRKMELGKKVVVDELRRAHEGMEKVAQRGQEEVKRVYEGAVKGLER